MWDILGKALRGLARNTGRLLSERARQQEAQGSINQQEISGAPVSLLRLWRSFLGWALSLLFVWEVAGRLILIPLLAPHWEASLPPPALEQVMALLSGMLGLL